LNRASPMGRLWGDMSRYELDVRLVREMGRYDEIWGDTVQEMYQEIWRDMARYGEISRSRGCLSSRNTHRLTRGGGLGRGKSALAAASPLLGLMAFIQLLISRTSPASSPPLSHTPLYLSRRVEPRTGEIWGDMAGCVCVCVCSATRPRPGDAPGRRTDRRTVRPLLRHVPGHAVWTCPGRVSLRSAPR